ncbi:MAG: hypothetical protein JXA23_11150, partial [Bacteroidales bacterium]|nr:hypothetical protein [Bacteroidales bacterium]
MDFFRKVKSRELPAEAILWLIMAPLLLIVFFLFGFGALLILPIGLVYGITTLILFIRSWNWGYLVQGLFFLTLGALAVALVFKNHIHSAWSISLAIVSVSLLLIMIFLGFNRNLKWWSYEILEMAALPVDDVQEGFTNRPMHVGQINCSRQELIRFARFLSRNLIAIPVVEADKVVFLIAHTRFKLITPNHQYASETYVCIHTTGNVTANISLEDYQKFKNTYAFDQLCHHLGVMFIRFYQAFREGKKETILE